MHPFFELIPLSENQRPVPSILEGTFHLSLGPKEYHKKKKMRAAQSASLTMEHIVIHFGDILSGIDMANVHSSLSQLPVQFTAGAFEILSVQFLAQWSGSGILNQGLKGGQLSLPLTFLGIRIKPD